MSILDVLKVLLKISSQQGYRGECCLSMILMYGKYLQYMGKESTSTDPCDPSVNDLFDP